jgi:uncharacterized protein involved in exopolysaccharide biosynthesis
MTAANEALSTDTPATVTFDTLSAAQELRKTGFEDRQAEAIVSTVSKAMSETVATKADLELQSAVTKADIEAMGAELKAGTEALRAELKAGTEALRAELKAGTEALRAELKADNEALRTEFKLFRQSVDSRFEKVDLRSDTLEKSLRQEMAALENRLILKLGGLMVTMAFLLLAIGPFYIRWVLSLMGLS